MSASKNSTRALLLALQDAIEKSDEPEFDRLLASTTLTPEQMSSYEDISLLYTACQSPSPVFGLKLLAIGHEPNKSQITVVGHEPYQSSIQSNFPIHEACAYSHISLVEALLHAGASASQANSVGCGPLHFAFLNDDREAIIKLLADHGANLNQQDSQGWTPLHTAMNVGSISSAKVLLARGARIDVEDNTGLTPACRAAWNNHQNVALWLIANGAQPSEAALSKNDNKLLKLSAAQAAARIGHCELLMKMMDDGRIDVSDDVAMKSLRHQAIKGDKQEAIALIDASRAHMKMKAVIEQARPANAHAA